MDNQKLLNDTVKELATRLGNVEIERATFRAQAIQALQENDSLKKQVEDLKKQLADQKKDDSASKTGMPKEDENNQNGLPKLPQDPQPGMQLWVF